MCSIYVCSTICLGIHPGSTKKNSFFGRHASVKAEWLKRLLVPSHLKLASGMTPPSEIERRTDYSDYNDFCASWSHPKETILHPSSGWVFSILKPKHAHPVHLRNEMHQLYEKSRLYPTFLRFKNTMFFSVMFEKNQIFSSPKIIDFPGLGSGWLCAKSPSLRCGAVALSAVFVPLHRRPPGWKTTHQQWNIMKNIHTS